jgi:dTDP-4-amino-4,6-dideoxygalactose transaminase
MPRRAQNSAEKGQNRAMQVPLVHLKPQYEELRDEINKAVLDVMEAHTFVLGPQVSQFERESEAYLGVKHAIGVSNGSDALYLALRALNVGPGDEVITTPYTYVATPESIWRAGAKIVFADIDPVSYCIDPSEVAKKVTKNTKAIMPVHLFGQCADIEGIRKAAPGIPIVEDAAQSWGASRHGKKSGALAEIATYSFYPTKTLGAFGDAGLVSTDSDELALAVRTLRVHGEYARKYYADRHGMNSRLDSMQAVILSAKLKRVDAWNDERGRIAAYFAKRFEGSKVTMARVAPGNHHVWHQCAIEVDRRNEMMDHLKGKGIGSGIYYPVPQHLQPCYADLGYKPGDFPVSERLSKRSLALPCWPGMSDAMMKHVADEILAFAGK